MKKLLFATFMLSSVLFGTAKAGSQTTEPEVTSKDAIQLASSPNLTAITSQWISAYAQTNSDIRITASEVSGETSLSANTLLITAQVLTDENTWQMCLGHSVIIPIANSENPLFEKIAGKGMLPADFTQLINGSQPAVTCFILDDQELISALSNFTQVDPLTISATKIATPSELITAIESNPNAIGFCRLTDIIQTPTNTFPSPIRVLPIDKNKNGRLESFENIYNTPQQLNRGVWLGKYPRELCRNIYAVSTQQPSEQAILNFLVWINTKGQNALSEAGYYPLSSAEIASNLSRVNPIADQVQLGKSQPSGSGLIWELGIALLFIVVAVLFIRLFKRKTAIVHSDDIVMAPALNTNAIAAPGGLFYDKSHTWVFMERDGLVKVGVDDFIQHVTGPLTQLKMKRTGDFVRKGEHILTISRDGKQLQLTSPVSGTIRESNTQLLDKPTQLNTSPYGLGWVYSIEPSNWYREVRFLFSVNRYREWLEDEFIRLKDFLAASANSSKLVLQDGGELSDNFLGEMSPVVWEDFQVHFLDKSK